MKSLVIALLVLFCSLPAWGFEKDRIAESVEQVSPLLNGMSVGKATLQNVTGEPLSLRALLMQKPSVVIFYRGGWCPYCNAQLAELKSLEPRLLAMGYQILAISPETPERLQQQKFDVNHKVMVLSDAKLEAIKAFGVGFYMSKAKAVLYEMKLGHQLAEHDGRAVLPAPAVYILDKNGEVLFNYINPNFKVRLSADLLLAAAKSFQVD